MILIYGISVTPKVSNQMMLSFFTSCN